jgi:glycosyltransferase involved in cell wall biosynthesis
MERPKVAYVMSRFPHLPETFILREMVEVERRGWEIALYPLIHQQQPVIHAEAKPWLARIRSAPFISKEILAENGRTFLRRPSQYLALGMRSLWENIPSPKFFSRAAALFPKAVYTARMMKAEGIAHIHAHYATHPALFAWLIHRLTDIPYSITVHAHDIFVDTTMLTTKMRDAAFIAAVSEFNRKHLGQLAGSWVLEKTHIVHCGVDPSQYPRRSSLPSAGGRFEILNIGSLQPYKGHRFLIQACILLRSKGIPFHCRIIGEGEEREELRKLIEGVGLQSDVELLGAMTQDEIAKILPTAHCYVQPSVITSVGKMEGIPVAIMEAFACELPVVATAISGIPELVRPSQTGYLVPPADSQSLANALVNVYYDPTAAANLARAGRELVMHEFTLSTNVERLTSLFANSLSPDRILQRQSKGAGEWGQK